MAGCSGELLGIEFMNPNKATAKKTIKAKTLTRQQSHSKLLRINQNIAELNQA
jgi:hypothetical protein